MLAALGSAGLGLGVGFALQGAEEREEKEPSEERRERRTNLVRVCVDRFLPPERLKEGFFKALDQDKTNDYRNMAKDVQEDKAGPIAPPKIAILYDKKWEQNR